jgi:hypothetical protein
MDVDREDFDDICDYSQYDAAPDNPPHDRSGTDLSTLQPHLAQYSVQVQVTPDNTLGAPALVGGIQRIDVTVTHASGLATVRITGYKADY